MAPITQISGSPVFDPQPSSQLYFASFAHFAVQTLASSTVKTAKLLKDKSKRSFAAFPLLGLPFPPALLAANGECADAPAEERLDLAQKRVAAQGAPCMGAASNGFLCRLVARNRLQCGLPILGGHPFEPRCQVDEWAINLRAAVGLRA